jgi:glycosyltransferase involved in cell wall biosynthesis
MPTLTLSVPQSLTFPLTTQAEKIAAIKRIEIIAKYLPLVIRDSLLEELESLTGSNLHTVPVMSKEDLRQLHSLGHGIGAHTDRHPILTQCDDVTARDEIVRPREILSDIVKAPIHGFAYPNGIPGKDLSSSHIELVKSAGYRFAVTTAAGVADKNCSPYQLPRFTPWGPGKIGTSYQIARNLLHRTTELPENDKRKKILMVAFHFPPQAGSSGLQRTLNFVKHMPSLGWQPTVLTANESAYEKTESGLDMSIPAGMHIARSFAFDTARHFSISGKYLQLMAIPDRWISWLLGGFATGQAIIRKEKPLLIWTTYPIATANLIGGQLSRIFNLPWIADFRDPMIISDTYPSAPLERWAKHHVEAFTIRNADRCVFTTERSAELYKNRYPFAADKCVVIPNGYDNDAFEGITPDRYGAPAETLLILHSGTIYPKERDPTTFFKAVAKLIDNGEVIKEKLVIRFRASHNEKQIMEIANICGLKDIVVVTPPLPYREAIAEMAGADILLVFQGSEFNTQIPAKIYEYLRTGSVIFGILDPKGDTAAELRKLAGVSHANIACQEDIAKNLKEIINIEFNETIKQQNISANQDKLLKFSRSSQAKQLTDLLSATSARKTKQ